MAGSREVLRAEERMITMCPKRPEQGKERGQDTDMMKRKGTDFLVNETLFELFSGAGGAVWTNYCIMSRYDPDAVHCAYLR